MILRAIEKHGRVSTKKLALLLGVSRAVIDFEIERLSIEGKIKTDSKGKHYIPKETTFSSWLLVSFMFLVCGVTVLGALAKTL